MVLTQPQLKRLPDNCLEIQLQGDWQISKNKAVLDEIQTYLDTHTDTRNILFCSKNLTHWDSSILTFLLSVIRLTKVKNIKIDQSGLPKGVRQLLALATAVPPVKDSRSGVLQPGFFQKLGTDFLQLIDSIGELLGFLGEAVIETYRLVRGKSRFRYSDFGLFLQETGAHAVPIISLISFLVGIILAFVGIMQLKLFGAQIYVADLVGISMVRQMGAIMTGIIMAGRTGAAFAAQLGTMQVNEEIDALRTLAVSPMEFLVLPRMLALTLMMPLLVLYADLVGILGGMVVAVSLNDISLHLYLLRTFESVGLNDLFIGLFMGIVFGILVALAGCMRGMQCERNASGVGDAATSAVVTGIVAIIISTAVITVICDVIGI